VEIQSTVCWENFPHDADIGVRGEGNNVAEAFEQAALALTAIITDPEKVRPVETIKIMCEAPCLELLLVATKEISTSTE